MVIFRTIMAAVVFFSLFNKMALKSDWKLVNKLRPPVGGVTWKEKYSKNVPIELIKVKQAFWPKQGRLWLSRANGTVMTGRNFDFELKNGSGFGVGYKNSYLGSQWLRTLSTRMSRG